MQPYPHVLIRRSPESRLGAHQPDEFISLEQVDAGLTFLRSVIGQQQEPPR